VDKSIGIELREARREKGMGLPEVSSVLCISKTYLRGLEECNKDQLPDSAFAIGFLRTYAEYLGLNADDLVARAKQQPAKALDSAPDDANDDTGDKATKDKEKGSKEGGIINPLKSHDSSMPAIPLVITVIAGVMSLAVAIGFYEPSRNSLADADLPPVDTHKTIETSQLDDQSRVVSVATQSDQDEMVAAVKAQAQSQDSAQSQNSAQTQTQTQVEIVAANDAWISLRDSEEQPLYRNVLAKGESYSFPANGAVHLATGHPENIQVFVDGRKVQAPTHQGRVVRDWRINAASDGGGFDQGDGHISEQ